jgi:hypothetical protein
MRLSFIRDALRLLRLLEGPTANKIQECAP